jgi:hypothetical protein
LHALFIDQPTPTKESHARTCGTGNLKQEGIFYWCAPLDSASILSLSEGLQSSLSSSFICPAMMARKIWCVVSALSQNLPKGERGWAVGGSCHALLGHVSCQCFAFDALAVVWLPFAQPLCCQCASLHSGRKCPLFLCNPRTFLSRIAAFVHAPSGNLHCNPGPFAGDPAHFPRLCIRTPAKGS